jgi:hypothetical protein
MKEVINNLPNLENRRLFPTLAIVLKNKDPEERRRIIIADPLFEGKVESNWIRPIRVTQDSDPPLPEVGQTVLVWYVNGDLEQGFYLPVILDSNPSRVKEDSINDSSQKIPGNLSLVVDKNSTLEIRENQQVTVDGDRAESVLGEMGVGVSGNLDIRTEQVLTIEAGQSVRISTDSGAFISLSTAGYVTVQDAFGRRITLGGTSGFGEWDLNSLPLKVINATSFTINNKEIATVSAVDSRGDSLTSRGW